MNRSTICRKCWLSEATHVFRIRDTIPGTQATYEYTTQFCAVETPSCARLMEPGKVLWGGRATVLSREPIEGKGDITDDARES